MFQLSGVDSWLMNPQGEKMNVLLRGTSGRSCAVDVAGRAVTIKAPMAAPIASVLDTDLRRVRDPPHSERPPIAPIPILEPPPVLVRRLDMAATTLQSFPDCRGNLPRVANQC